MLRHERGPFVMLPRRLVRPVIVTALLACICYLWLAYHADLVVVIPVSVPVGQPFEEEIQRPAKPTVRIAKVTVAANTLNSSIIHQALRTHQVQNEFHGYTHHITTGELVGEISENDNQGRPSGAWSKPAYLLSLIVAELTKPESERLEWMFWFDADTVVMNPHTPLEIFLPPTDVPEIQNIHLLIASNWDGLNSGAFGLRVHPWSVSVLSAVLAYPLYNAKMLQNDRFRDQSAFQWLLQSPESFLVKGPFGGRENWAEVPMRWFNSLPINNAFSKKWDWIFNYNMTAAMFDNGTKDVYPDGNSRTVQPWKIMQGDMVVHFAGSTNVRDSWMVPWLERAEKYLPEWSNATTQEELKLDAKIFWNMTASRIRIVRKHEREKLKNGTPKPNLGGKHSPMKPAPSPVDRMQVKSAAKVEAEDGVVPKEEEQEQEHVVIVTVAQNEAVRTALAISSATSSATASQSAEPGKL